MISWRIPCTIEIIYFKFYQIFVKLSNFHLVTYELNFHFRLDFRYFMVELGVNFQTNSKIILDLFPT